MGSLKVRYHPEAAKELAEAIDWYAARDPRVAERFGDLYVEKLREVLKSPRRWARHRDGTRQVYLRPFSYLLIVRELGEALQVVAVAHTSRRQGYWRKRLR
jgi:toxin ParE1/3/4